jgi:hypothetical protein
VRSKYSALLIIGFFSAMLCLAGRGFAQSTSSGDIRGTVTDPTGAAIPGTSVVVLNTDTGVSTPYQTDAVGVYDTVSILPGKYRVTFSKEGFKTLVRDGITVQVGSPITVDATLALGTSQQTVEVVGEAPLMKTESAEQATNLQYQTMAELPNVTRTWTYYTNLLPGVQPGSQGFGGGGAGYSVTVNGTMPDYASILADGSNVALPHSTNTLPMVFESVSEVRIDTSTFSAQYGNGAVVFNQVSKTGTNKWHGSAYEFVQNDKLNARSFFSSSVPLSKYNNFGGAVGGPIRKDKIFFYFNIEKLINNSSYWTYYTFPTAAMRQGNFSDPAFPTIYDPDNLLPDGSRAPFTSNQISTDRMDPLAVAVQQYFPAPNLTGYVNNYHVNLKTVSPHLWILGRMDYNISSRHRLTVTFNRHDNHWNAPSATTPIDSFTDYDTTYFPQIAETWTISPTVVNEFRLGGIRDVTGPRDDDLGKDFPQKLGWTYAVGNKFPGVSIGGPVGATSLGANINTALYAQTSYDPSDTVTLIRGRHILHFGAEVLYQQDNDTKWAVVNSGNFNFPGVYTRQTPFGTGGLGYADFLLGAVHQWSATNGPINAMREISPQAFVQDDIKVKPNLTLNLGLRWQSQGGWYSLHNTLGIMDPTLINPATGTLGAMWFAPANGKNSAEAPVHDIFLPRVGFSWNFKTNWVVRGGFGIYAIPWSQDTYSYLDEGTGSGFTGSLSDATNASPLFSFSATDPTLNYEPVSKEPDSYNGKNTYYNPYNTPVARNYQWSLSVQRQLPAGVIAEAAYVGSHAYDMPFSWAKANEVPEKLLGTSPDPQTLRPFPQYLSIDAFYYDSISNYNSLQLSLQKRFATGVNFGINYTWSHMLDTMDSQGWGGTGLTTNFQYSSYNRAANYGNAYFDRRHMLKGYMIYALPVGKGKKLLNQGGPLDWVAGGWQASAMGIVESGTPFTPIMGTQDLTGALDNKNWFPDLVGDPKLSNPTIHGWFNTAAYAEPAPYTFGNNGRNTLYGPGVADLDFSLAKSFAIPKLEDGRLQLRFDSVNVFNHPSFGNPNASIGTPGAGIITSTTYGGRTIQLGARLMF